MVGRLLFTLTHNGAQLVVCANSSVLGGRVQLRGLIREACAWPLGLVARK